MDRQRQVVIADPMGQPSAATILATSLMMACCPRPSCQRANRLMTVIVGLALRGPGIYQGKPKFITRKRLCHRLMNHTLNLFPIRIIYSCLHIEQLIVTVDEIDDLWEFEV